MFKSPFDEYNKTNIFWKFMHNNTLQKQLQLLQRDKYQTQQNIGPFEVCIPFLSWHDGICWSLTYTWRLLWNITPASRGVFFNGNSIQVIKKYALRECILCVSGLTDIRSHWHWQHVVLYKYEARNVREATHIWMSLISIWLIDK